MPRWVGPSRASRCVGQLVLEEPEGEVDAFELAEPPFCFGELASGDEVGVNLVEALDQDRVNLKQGAADAGMFVLAGGGVGAPAVAEFDFAFIEVFLEFFPFRAGRRTVFPARPGPPACGRGASGSGG
jgi:hypothetical protein